MSEEIKEKIKAYYIANDIDEILNYITNLQQKLEQLENIRKEAIEYITTEQLYTDYQWGKSQYVKILKDLLNILNKGGISKYESWGLCKNTTRNYNKNS